MFALPEGGPPRVQSVERLPVHPLGFDLYSRDLGALGIENAEAARVLRCPRFRVRYEREGMALLGDELFEEEIYDGELPLELILFGIPIKLEGSLDLSVSGDVAADLLIELERSRVDGEEEETIEPSASAGRTARDTKSSVSTGTAACAPCFPGVRPLTWTFRSAPGSTSGQPRL